MRKTLAIAIGAALGVALALVGTAALAARNSSGTFTLNPSSPFVTGTPISSSAVNTRFSDIATELTDSASRSGKGAFLAPLALYSGNATLPGLTFGNDTNSGLYLVGNDDIGLSIGGTKRWEHTTAGQTESGWLEVLGTTTIGGVLTLTAPQGVDSVVRLASPSTATGSYANITGLSFSVAASGTYEFEAVLLGSTTAGLGTYEYTFTAPAAPTLINVGGYVNPVGSAGGGTSAIGAAGQDLGGLGTSATGFLVLRGVLVNGANAGTLQLQHKNSSTAVGTTLAGSFLKYRRIDQ